MSEGRIAKRSKLGFEVVKSLPADDGTFDGAMAPFRDATTSVMARYAPLTSRERWSTRLAVPLSSHARPVEAVLTETHLYVRYEGIGGDHCARLPRTTLDTSWREGSTVCFGSAGELSVALAHRENDALLTALGEEIASRPNAPFRSVGMVYARQSLAHLVGTQLIVVAGFQGAVAMACAAGAFVLSASWFGSNRVHVTSEGVTVDVGMFPKWTRFFPRQEVHSVVIRLASRGRSCTVTTEIEMRDARQVPTHYVIAHAVTTEPAREFAERVMAPDARRVATLLGARGPRWDA